MSATLITPETQRRQSVDLRRYISITWKWAWLLVLAVSVAAAASYYSSKSATPIYRTSITLMVGEDAANPNLSPEQVAVSQRLADSYANMVRRQPILEATADALGFPASWRELQERVLVNRVTGTQFFEIRVIDNDPGRVKAIADEISRQLIIQSPTAEYMRQMEGRRQFLTQQLDSLQANISQAEAAIVEKQAALKDEVSARAVLDRQDEIQALMLNLNGWRSTYASLLASSQGRAPNTLTVIEPAYLPEEPVGPDTRANVLMAAAIALLLALGAVALIEYVNDNIGTPEDVDRVLGLPSLGTVMDMGGGQTGLEKLINSRPPHDPVCEAYRVLRTNIQFESANRDCSVLLITSPGVHEGKSLTATNLAMSFAQAGKKTILVDADLRHPSLSSFLGPRSDTGLSSLFLDERQVTGDGQSGDPLAFDSQKLQRSGELRRQIELFLTNTPVENLRLLSSGPVPPNPAELLNSPRMAELLRQLKKLGDVIILDSPPLLPIADAAILASREVGVVLVAEAGKTRSSAAAQARAILIRANAFLLGVVLNRAPAPRYSYYYRYGGTGESRPGRLRLYYGRIKSLLLTLLVR